MLFGSSFIGIPTKETNRSAAAQIDPHLKIRFQSGSKEEGKVVMPYPPVRDAHQIIRMA